MRRVRPTFAVLLAAAPWPGLARGAEIVLSTPSDDRWHYPFNFSPGDRGAAGVFGSLGDLEFAGFNDRDGMFYIGWSTAGAVQPGHPPQDYEVCEMIVEATNLPGASWLVDLTVDEWFTFDVNRDGIVNGDGVPRGSAGDRDGESSDLDPGRPLELFGLSFGPGFAYATWDEGDEYVGATCDFFTQECVNAARNPFPFAFRDSTTTRLHVEDSIKGRHNGGLNPPLCASVSGLCPFTPIPWAIGLPRNYTPGAQATSFDVRFVVDLTLSGGQVRRYFQEQLAGGRLFVAITSLLLADLQGEQATYPTLHTKESVSPGAKAPRLTLQVAVGPTGDFNGDGAVLPPDIDMGTACLAGPGATPTLPAPRTPAACRCAFDDDGDGDVDLRDAAAWMTNFGAP